MDQTREIIEVICVTMIVIVGVLALTRVAPSSVALDEKKPSRYNGFGTPYKGAMVTTRYPANNAKPSEKQSKEDVP